MSDLNDSDCLVGGMRLADRFGDSGVVGLVIAAPRSREMWEIEVLLLSCRVIGRRAESALLAWLGGAALERGATWLTGWFLPTERNAPARDCYRDHGFELLETRPDGGQRWQLDLRSKAISVPPWIQVASAALPAST
jgi:FkbH-like protein